MRGVLGCGCGNQAAEKELLLAASDLGLVWFEGAIAQAAVKVKCQGERLQKSDLGRKFQRSRPLRKKFHSSHPQKPSSLPSHHHSRMGEPSGA